MFIAADIGMQQLDEEGEVDILQTLSTLRQDRGGIIQTKEQYIFLHKVSIAIALIVIPTYRLPHVTVILRFYWSMQEE